MSSVDNIEELKNRLKSLGVVLQSVPPSDTSAPTSSQPPTTSVVDNAVTELKKLLESPQRAVNPENAQQQPAHTTDDAALNRSIVELQDLLERNYARDSKSPDVGGSPSTQAGVKPGGKRTSDTNSSTHESETAPKHKKRNNRKHADSKAELHKGIPYSRSVPHTPLAVLLTKLKENEDEYKEEKAELRREARSQSKRANKLEQEVAKLQAQLKHGQTETKALLAALKNRDNQMFALQQRLDGLEAALGPSADPDHYEDKYKIVSSEKAEMQEILENTVQKLESVSSAYQASNELIASLETKLGDLDQQRAEACEAAATATAHAEALAANQQKYEWQLSVLEKLVEIHCSGNQKKVDAIRRVIHSQHTADDLVVLLKSDKKEERRRHSREEPYGTSLLPPSLRSVLDEARHESKHRSKRK